MACVATVTALSLTGCGSDSGSGPDTKAGSSPGSGSSSSSKLSSAQAAATVKASIKAAEQAKTFRVVADLTEKNEPLDLDLHYGSNGVDGSITMTGTKLQIKVAGTTLYFKAPDKFWKDAGGAQGTQVARMYGGRWVKTPSSSGFGKGFSDFSDPKSFIGSFTKDLDGDALRGAEQVGTSTVGGTATTTISDGSGEGTIDVPTSGTPYPLKLVSTATGASADAGTITFSGWDEPFTVKPPKSSLQLPG